MNLLRNLIHTYLYLPLCFQKLAGTGAFSDEGAIYIPASVSPDDKALKKALLRHYVRQYHEASCSVASVVTIVNALRSGDNELPEPISQMDILERVRNGHWKERMSESGHNGRRGLPLALLGQIVKSSLIAYDLQHAAVETVPARMHPDAAWKIKETLRRRLSDFEEKANCLIIAHFNQGAYVPALGIPHISPVGGYDARTGRVTILDVDALQQAPYQVGFETFYKGMARPYSPVFRPFGYITGGYVFVQLH